MRGQLGVVSGTGLDALLSRRLQLGDPGGHIREAIQHFPLQDIAQRVWDRYFIPGGKKPTAPYKSKPLPSIKPARALTDLTVVGSFVEVFLAKAGHNGIVGINLLEKIQLPTIPTLFGAMMAGVDYVLMGAGIPRAIPAILDDLAALRPTQLRIDVTGALANETFAAAFDPNDYASAPLKRPEFLAIVSSTALASTLARKASGKVNGFIVEGSTAGGHNAPPRGSMQLDDKGEPIYGPRDEPDLQTIRELGLPFWLAGSYGTPEGLKLALSLGAAGVQVGTPFAFCEESGIAPAIKERVLETRPNVFTDPLASPTGFPFKVAQLEGTLSDSSIYEERERICDLGYLRESYRKDDGTVGYRCPAEPIEDFVKKGGDAGEAPGRKCLCNGLIANVGMPQVRKDGKEEPPIVTAGDTVGNLSRFFKDGGHSYTAGDVIDCLLS
jgi:nitronate monooxygenase